MQSQRISDLPNELLSETTTSILNHLVGLIRIGSKESPDTIQLIGSGTLVQLDDTFGILTAEHVLKAIPLQGHLGIILPYFDREHRYSIDISHIIKMPIARGDNDCDGPDLAFIQLPQPYIGQIKAHGTFYNLSYCRNEVINDPIDIKTGMWAVSGYPDEYTKEIESIGGFDGIMKCEGNCLFGSIEKPYSSGDFDYIEMPADYSNDVPVSFGGVSGGGLWHIVLEQTPQGNIKVKSIILSGVAFYQSALENNTRSLKCHWLMSVYQVAYDYIKDHSKI
jgi:hypothetical protein